jgi:hypothetical protein
MTFWNATIFQQTVLAINRLYVLSRPKVVVTSSLQINVSGGNWTFEEDFCHWTKSRTSHARPFRDWFSIYTDCRKQNNKNSPHDSPFQLLILFSWTCALILHIGYSTQGEQIWFAIEVINWLEIEPHTPFFMALRYFKIVLLSVGFLAGVGMLAVVLYQVS